MGEYERIQQKQKVSRTLQMTPKVNRQASISQILQNKVIQRESYTAGVGSGWHIHYNEHMKYNGTDGTRVNFDGRTRKKILQDLGQKITSNRLEGKIKGADFKACIKWIFQNL